MYSVQDYGYVPSVSEIEDKLAGLESGLDAFDNAGVYLKCFSMMDITTLKTEDSPASVFGFVDRINKLPKAFPGYPMPASVCVFPNLAYVVKRYRTDPEVHVTAVSACFPTSQSFIEVKELECRLAVRAGADEIDVVLALNAFIGGDLESAYNEIRTIRKAVDEEAAYFGRKVVLKVILETGLLVSAGKIAVASFLAMEAGADFIKTSTGKVQVNATPQAAYVMCECIRAFYEKTGKKVGFKAAGGISSARDALVYYSIVSSVLGDEWLDRSSFRFGVSRLGNGLMSAIEGNTVKYF